MASPSPAQLLQCAWSLLRFAVAGGGFGVLPAFVSDLWGSKISGATHGITIGVWALSTIIGVPIFTAIVKGNSIKSSTGATVPQPEGAVWGAWGGGFTLLCNAARRVPFPSRRGRSMACVPPPPPPPPRHAALCRLCHQRLLAGGPARTGHPCCPGPER